MDLEVIGRNIGSLLVMALLFYLGYKFFNSLFNKKEHKETT